MTFRFTIPITPKGQKRDRIGTIGNHARSYKDAKQAEYESKVSALLAQHRPDKPAEEPIELVIICYLPIPKSKSKKWKEAAKREEIRPIGKPDISNMVKNIEDIMSGVFYRDDAQIVKLIASKWYSDDPH